MKIQNNRRSIELYCQHLANKVNLEQKLITTVESAARNNQEKFIYIDFDEDGTHDLVGLPSEEIESVENGGFDKKYKWENAQMEFEKFQILHINLQHTDQRFLRREIEHQAGKFFIVALYNDGFRGKDLDLDISLEVYNENVERRQITTI